MESLVADIERSFAELEKQLNDPGLYDDPKNAAEVGRKHKRMQEAHRLALRWRELTGEIEEAKELASDDEAEIREMAKTQLEQAEGELPRVEEDIRLSMVDPDPDDSRDVILEIRPGAGGDEAAIWAGDLLEMYSKFAARRGLKPEIISTQPAEAGGFTDVTLGIKGEDAWAQLKWESGVHRVQRVPVTETQGRIHTSTATVVVRAEVEAVEVDIDMNDVRVDVFRSSGPGGQSVNTTDSAVRLTHIPTGLVVSCQNEKSQHQNKDQALRVLRSRLYELEIQKQEEALSAHRRAAIGSGDRSEKIRTYNYPEKRVTDHRINLKVPQLDKVLAGDLDDFVDALRSDEQQRLLKDQLGDS